MRAQSVAPHAGAWIETDEAAEKWDAFVAPHAGAWIETHRMLAGGRSSVAPLAGAWIETFALRAAQSSGSPLTRGRGLKLDRQAFTVTDRVAPHAGAWIETPIDRTVVLCRSRPSRGGVD